MFSFVQTLICAFILDQLIVPALLFGDESVVGQNAPVSVPVSGCRLPPLPAHGRYSISNNQEMVVADVTAAPLTMLYYSCNAGYKVNAPFAVCQQDNTWSSTPVCKPVEEIVTSSPITGRPGSNSVMYQQPTRSVLRSPVRQRDDRDDGDLDGCRLPLHPSNGWYVLPNHPGQVAPGDRLPHFTVLRYSCARGVPSQQFSMCQPNSTWSATPTCQLSGGLPYPNENPERAATPLRPNLSPNYDFKIDRFSKEEINFSQDIQSPECLLPSAPSYGRYTVSNYGKSIVPGDVVPLLTLLQYSCEPGYGLLEKWAVCQKDGSWSSSPRCILKTGTPWPPETGSSGCGARKCNQANPLWNYPCFLGGQQQPCESPAPDGCLLPGHPAHGRYTVSQSGSLGPGDRVRPSTVLAYACGGAYDLSARYSVCQADSTWSAAPRCFEREVNTVPSKKRDKCRLPLKPINGGYTRMATDTVTNDEKIRSLDNEIDPEMNISPLLQGFRDNHTLKYYCDQGFDLTVRFDHRSDFCTMNDLRFCDVLFKEVIARCLETNEWSLRPYCSKRCHLPASSSVEFICHVPLSSRAPPCLGNDCQKPLSIKMLDDLKLKTDNFGSQIPCEPLHGVEARPVCKAGHHYEQNDPVYTDNTLPALRCNNGTWSSRIPECTPDIVTSTPPPVKKNGECQPPVPPENGSFKVVAASKQEYPSGYPMGLTVEFSCDRGFSTPDKFSTCVELNETYGWNVTAECNRMCEMIAPFNYSIGTECTSPLGNVTSCAGEMEHGSAVRPLCAVYVGSRIPLKCNKGNWVGQMPKCEAEVTTTVLPSVGCPLPIFPDHGGYVVSNYEKPIVAGDVVVVMSQLTYSCDEGYEVSVKDSFCENNYTWSDSPTCSRNDSSTNRPGCPLPKFPDHGVYAVSNYEKPIVAGDVVVAMSQLTYSCDKGYEVSVKDSFCEDNYTWSDFPTCKLQTTGKIRTGCSLPPFPPNGSYQIAKRPEQKIKPGDNVEASEVIEYKCDANYSLSEKTSECQEDGTWKSSPTCYQSDPPSSKGCILPLFPENGSYVIANDPARRVIPGEKVGHYVVIKYSCNPGYDMLEKTTECQDDNTWKSSPNCTLPCKVKPSFTVDFKCRNRTNDWIDCLPSIPEGAHVSVQCKPGHVVDNEVDFIELDCRDGKLTTRPKCITDCGSEKSFGNTLSIGGRVTEPNTFPWHVGIYQMASDPQDNTKSIYTQICGGSILHTHVIVSAAHCFWDSEGDGSAVSAENFRIAAGKYYRSWDDKMESNRVQRREIKEILIPEDYKGGMNSQADDLAIVVLKIVLTFSNSIRAVCYDITHVDFDDRQLEPGKKGKVAGWGIDETGNPSNKLKSLELPVVSKPVCRDHLKAYSFERYMIRDKFCAGYMNAETAVCQGDSGGGLVFNATDFDGRMRWYLRGVVSIAPTKEGDDKNPCQANTYAMFTRVFSLRTWLIKELRKLTGS